MNVKIGLFQSYISAEYYLNWFTFGEIIKKITKHSSKDEIANVNFLRRHRIRSTYYKIRKLRHNVSRSLQKFHHGKIDLQLNLKIILSK